MDIQVRVFIEPDRAEAQEQAILSATNYTEQHLSLYKNDPRSFDGKYVSADLFKETFPVFSASKEARNRYNTVVHNAAAVLSDLQFKRLVKEKPRQSSENVIFLTGIPGAGKTTSVITRNAWPIELAVVFEGQLSRPESAYSKIDAALSSGYKVLIVAVHAIPEDALSNTITRFNEHGRGASIAVMSDIQGNLPNGLTSIKEKYKDQVQLRIRDFRDRANPKFIEGWEQLDLLASEGNSETIKERLTKVINQYRDSGQISEAAYRQAIGKPLIDDRQNRSVVDRNDRGHEKDALRRGLPETNSQTNLVKPGKSR